MRQLSVAAVVLLTALASWAGEPTGKVELEIGAGSTLSLEGNSTLHAYALKARVLKLSGSIEGDTLRDAVARGASSNVVLTIPVGGLASGKTKLDDNLYAALKKKQYPEILFFLDRFTLSPKGDTLTLDGRLRIAGRERVVKVVTAARFEGGSVRLTGDLPLLMTDFGIKPPTFFLGAMKTDDKVVVRFDLLLGARLAGQLARKEGTPS